MFDRNTRHQLLQGAMLFALAIGSLSLRADLFTFVIAVPLGITGMLMLIDCCTVA
ncbi:MAG: hypothetical protein IPO81_02785 [Kouleothrix sp.]|nr:hypothetical protein [Kouleothrix sp.]